MKSLTFLLILPYFKHFWVKYKTLRTKKKKCKKSTKKEPYLMMVMHLEKHLA
jgi:hypothetical protein